MCDKQFEKSGFEYGSKFCSHEKQLGQSHLTLLFQSETYDIEQKIQYEKIKAVQATVKNISKPWNGDLVHTKLVNKEIIMQEIIHFFNFFDRSEFKLLSQFEYKKNYVHI